MTLAVVQHATTGASLIKSRERVKAHGEVNTPGVLVDQMIDVVAATAADIDATFFEPAAGDGNFLVAILERKLAAVEALTRDPVQLRLESLRALASIYGVELLADNHRDAKAAMLRRFERFHAEHGTATGPGDSLSQAAAYLIDCNIVQGNTLDGTTADGKPITLSWWHRLPNQTGGVQRVAFTFASLVGGTTSAPAAPSLQLSLFDDIGSAEPQLPSYDPCRIDRVHLMASR